MHLKHTKIERSNWIEQKGQKEKIFFSSSDERHYKKFFKNEKYDFRKLTMN